MLTKQGIDRFEVSAGKELLSAGVPVLLDIG